MWIGRSVERTMFSGLIPVSKSVTCVIDTEGSIRSVIHSECNIPKRVRSVFETVSDL